MGAPLRVTYSAKHTEIMNKSSRDDRDAELLALRADKQLVAAEVQLSYMSVCEKHINLLYMSVCMYVSVYMYMYVYVCT